MPLWYRVFGRSPTPVEPAAVGDFLRSLNVPATAEFEPDHSEWVSAAIRLADATEIHVERFRAEEEGIRTELNTWAAFLETCDYSPNNVPLMEQMIQTSQLFTVRRPADVANEVAVEGLCCRIAGFLARTVDGVYQVDEEGFYDATGRLILPEL